MKAAIYVKATIFLAATVCAQRGLAQTLIDADFSRGDFARLGWKATGDWDVFSHPPEVPNRPGPVARLPANKAAGTLTKTFAEINNPKQLTLSLDYGWGWARPHTAAIRPR